MFNIEETSIELTRGDSASLQVNLVTGSGEPYEMQTGDKLTLTVRQTLNGAVALTQDSYTTTIDLLPAKTKVLPLGECFYDIQLTCATGDIFTIVGVGRDSNSNWYTMEEVTQ